MYKIKRQRSKGKSFKLLPFGCAGGGTRTPCREALDPKSSASTNFATPAKIFINETMKKSPSQKRIAKILFFVNREWFCGKYVRIYLILKNRVRNFTLVLFLTLFLYPGRDLNPHGCEATGF